MISKKTEIFISYAREDHVIAKKLCDDLRTFGVNPWLDTEKLLPGQFWESAIEEAIEKSRFFLAILSNKSVNKTGVVQSELKKAFALLEKHPENDIFLIPVRVEDCTPSSRRLRDIHWVDMFPEWQNGLRKIIDAVEHCSLSQGIFSLLADDLKDVPEFSKPSSNQNQILAKILKLFSMKKELTRRQVSLELETAGTPTRAYLARLVHSGLLSRHDNGERQVYCLTDDGEMVLKANSLSDNERQLRDENYTLKILHPSDFKSLRVPVLIWLKKENNSFEAEVYGHSILHSHGESQEIVIDNLIESMKLFTVDTIDDVAANDNDAALKLRQFIAYVLDQREKTKSQTPAAITEITQKPLDDMAVNILLRLWKFPEGLPDKVIAKTLDLDIQTVTYHIEELEKDKMIYAHWRPPRKWQLIQKGRGYLLENKFVS